MNPRIFHQHKARLAWLLSGLLSPFLLVPIFTVFLLLELSGDSYEFLKLYLLCIGCSCGLPAVYIGYKVCLGEITDMHVKLLEQRRGPFRVGVGGLGLLAVALWVVKAPFALCLYVSIIFVNGIGFAWISESWKISVHTGSLGACLAGALAILNWSPWWLLLQIPLVWARAHRKRHHPRQGLGGALLGFLPTWVVLILFL